MPETNPENLDKTQKKEKMPLCYQTIQSGGAVNFNNFNFSKERAYMLL